MYFFFFSIDGTNARSAVSDLDVERFACALTQALISYWCLAFSWSSVRQWENILETVDVNDFSSLKQARHSRLKKNIAQPFAIPYRVTVLDVHWTITHVFKLRWAWASTSKYRWTTPMTALSSSALFYVNVKPSYRYLHTQNSGFCPEPSTYSVYISKNTIHHSQ